MKRNAIRKKINNVEYVKPALSLSAEPIQCRFEISDKVGDGAAHSNCKGMPGGLRGGLESLSGFDMSCVRGHYNSSESAKLGAPAYAQGTNRHLGPRQEKHLPHEAWHVVQQLQGRVKSSHQIKGAL